MKKNEKKIEKKAPVSEEFGKISNKEDLKKFLLSIRDRMADGSVAAVYAASALNHLFNLEGIYQYLDEENKEMARDIWLRVKQAGMQLNNPPLLFSAGGKSAEGNPKA